MSVGTFYTFRHPLACILHSSPLQQKNFNPSPNIIYILVPSEVKPPHGPHPSPWPKIAAQQSQNLSKSTSRVYKTREFLNEIQMWSCCFCEWFVVTFWRPAWGAGVTTASRNSALSALQVGGFKTMATFTCLTVVHLRAFLILIWKILPNERKIYCGLLFCSHTNISARELFLVPTTN